MKLSKEDTRMSIDEIKEKLAELEAKIPEFDKELNDIISGLDDDESEVDTAETEDRANKIISEKRATLEKIDGMKKELDKAEGIERAKRGELKKIEERGKENKKMNMEEFRASREYADIYADFLKTGNNNVFARANTILGTDAITGDNTSKVPTPVVLENAIMTAWDDAGKIVDLCKKLQVKGLVRIPVETSAPDAVIHTEGSAAPDSEALAISYVEIAPQTIKKWVLVTDEMLAMNSIGFLEYIGRELAYKIIKKLEDDIVSDLATRTADAYVSEISADADSDAIYKAQAELADEADAPVIIVNKKTYFNTLKTLKDGANRPIYNEVSNNEGVTYTLNGIPVIFSSVLPEYAAGAGVWAVVGDFSGYTVNYPNGDGVATVTDPYSMAERDLVKIVGKLYAGHAADRPKFFTRLKTTA